MAVVTPRANPLIIAFFWPAYILPFIVFIGRQPSTGTLTAKAVSFVILTIVVLAAVSWMVFSRVTGGEVVVEVMFASVWTWVLAIVLWPAFGLLVLYFAIRRTQLDQIRAEVIQQVMLQLAEIEDPFASTEKIAQLLFERAAIGERIFILQYEAESDSVRVVACAGEGAEVAAGYELPKGKGVSRRAINLREAQNVGNVRKDPDFVEGGLPSRGSEMSVPIIVTDELGTRVLGTINVQDNAVFAFTEDDARTVETLADLLGAFSRRYSERFFESLTASLQVFYELADPEAMIGEAVDVARKLFDGALVCYYRLASGTGAPLPYPYIGGEFNEPAFFEDENLFSEKSKLIQWILEWKPKFIAQMEYSKELRSCRFGFGTNFQDAEKVVSMCFLPLGSRNFRVGALLMFFRERNVFPRIRSMEMLTYAREITPHLARAEFVTAVYKGFARPQLHFHSTLAEAGLGRGAWEKILEDVQVIAAQYSDTLYQQVKQLGSGLKMFLDRMRASEATDITRLRGLGITSLTNALDDACGDLVQRFSGIIVREIDDLIELESEELKLILFIFVTEAVRNAFVHGKTVSRVDIKIVRGYTDIVVRVDDDGVGFDPSSAIPGLDGIFSISRMGEQLLGALPTDWNGTAPGRGTHCIWTVPALPEPRALHPLRREEAR